MRRRGHFVRRAEGSTHRRRGGLVAEPADDQRGLGHWTYLGTGWTTDAQTILANAAAARAREYDQWKAAQRTNRTNREPSDERTM